MDSRRERLAALKDLWALKRGARIMPARADLPVSALKPWLGHLALIELAGAQGETFRLCGINLFPRFGGDVTNRSVASLPDEIAASIRAITEQIAITKSPFEGEHVRMIGHYRVVFAELGLPLSEDGVAPTTLLLASYKLTEDRVW